MRAGGRSPLRCAIVGVGWAGTRLLEAAAETEGALRVVCLIDPDRPQREAVGRRFGIPVLHADLEAALSEDFEAVLICSPHRLHAPQALLAIAADRHVLVEKPIALDLASADAMVDAAARAGVVLGVAENEVHEAWVDQLRELVTSGEVIGELVFGAIVSGGRMANLSYPGRRAWLADPERGGTGSWMLHGIHTVAVARRVFGGFHHVHAIEHRTASFGRPDLEATMSLHLRTATGVPIHLLQTPEVDLGADRRVITVHGDRGSIRASARGWVRIDGSPGPGPAAQGPHPVVGESSYARELRAFVAAIRDGTDMTTSGSSERDTLAVVLGATEAVRTGLVVDLV